MKGIGAEWLEKQGFNENGYTYVYYGQDSYEIKSMLKDAGFRFNRELMWHCPDKDNFYAAKCFEVHYTTVLQLMAYGKGFYFEDTAQKIKAKIDSYLPPSNSAWSFGEVKDKVNDIEVIIKENKPLETIYGIINIIKFETANLDVLSWWTSCEIKNNIGDKVLLSGTIKSLSVYKGVKETVLTRCKIKNI